MSTEALLAKRTEWIERTNHSYELYKAAFGGVIRADAVTTIVDVGAGNSPFAEVYSQRSGKRIVRVDPDYAVTPPTGKDWLANTGQDMKLPSGFSDATVSAFLMQHLNPDEQKAVAQEMLRVTTEFDGDTRGVVGIFPLYKPEKLARLLSREGFCDGSDFTIYSDEQAFNTSIETRKLILPTLWIPKKHTVDRQAILLETIARSGALCRGDTIAKMARCVLMRIFGNNEFNVA